MKDYYKILGVDEEASEEEIRAHWVELMKRHHPDLNQKHFNDETIKEINEAYEVLRDHSKRLDYDLERTLKKSFIKKFYSRAEKRNLGLRIWFPLGLFLSFIMVGWVVIKWLYIPEALQSEASYEIEKILEKKIPVSTLPDKKESDVPLERDVPNETSPAMVPPKPKIKWEPPILFPPKGEGVESIQKDEMISKEAEKGVTLRVENLDEISNRVDEEIPKGVHQEVFMRASKEFLEMVSQEIPRGTSFEVHKEVSEEVQKGNPQKEEVKQFIEDYIDRYEQKDIQGFMNLFSLKAIQNQREGFEAIRKIYKNFFEQSQKLHYRMEEVKINMDPHRVEVRARFHVDQRLKKGEVEKIWKGNIHWVLVKEDGVFKIVALNYQYEKPP